MPTFLVYHLQTKQILNYNFFLPLRQFLVYDIILLALARFSPNFLISAHLGARFVFDAMSFIFLPSGFLVDIFIIFSCRPFDCY